MKWYQLLVLEGLEWRGVGGCQPDLASDVCLSLFFFPVLAHILFPLWFPVDPALLSTRREAAPRWQGALQGPPRILHQPTCLPGASF